MIDNIPQRGFVRVPLRIIFLLMVPVLLLFSESNLTQANAAWYTGSSGASGSGSCSFVTAWQVSKNYDNFVSDNKDGAVKHRYCNGTQANGGDPGDKCGRDRDDMAYFWLGDTSGNKDKHTWVEWYQGGNDDQTVRNNFIKSANTKSTLKGWHNNDADVANTIIDTATGTKNRGEKTLVWVCRTKPVGKSCDDDAPGYGEYVMKPNVDESKVKRDWDNYNGPQMNDACFQRCPKKKDEMNSFGSGVVGLYGPNENNVKNYYKYNKNDDGTSRKDEFIPRTKVKVPNFGDRRTSGTSELNSLARGAWCFSGEYYKESSVSGTNVTTLKTLVNNKPIYLYNEVATAQTPLMPGREFKGESITQTTVANTGLADLFAACIAAGKTGNKVDACWPSDAEMEAANAAANNVDLTPASLSNENKNVMDNGGTMRVAKSTMNLSAAVQRHQVRSCVQYKAVPLVFRVTDRANGGGNKKVSFPNDGTINGYDGDKPTGSAWEADLFSKADWQGCEGANHPKTETGANAPVTYGTLSSRKADEPNSTWVNGTTTREVTYTPTARTLSAAWFAVTNHCNANQYDNVRGSLGITSPASNNTPGEVGNGDDTKWLSGSLVSNVYTAAQLNGGSPLGAYSRNDSNKAEFYDRVCVYNGELANSKTLNTVAANDMPEEYTFFRDGRPHVLGKDNGNVTGETPFFVPTTKNDNSGGVLVNTKVEPKASIVTRDPEGTPSTKDSNVVGMKAGSLAFAADDKLFKEVSATGTDSIRRPTQFTATQEDSTATVAVAVGPYTQLGGTATWPSEAKKPQVVTMAWYFAPTVRNTYPMTNLGMTSTNAARFTLANSVGADGVVGRVDAVNDSTVVHGSTSALQDQREMMYDNSGSTASTANNLDRAMPYGANKDLATGEWLTKPSDFNRYYFSIRYVRAVSE